VEGRAALQQRIDAGGAGERADGPAVLRCRRIDEVRGLQRARTWHVLRHHGRVAGNMLADVAREVPTVQVVAAANREADYQIDGFALVEFLDTLRRRRRNGGSGERQESNGKRNAQYGLHGASYAARGCHRSSLERRVAGASFDHARGRMRRREFLAGGGGAL